MRFLRNFDGFNKYGLGRTAQQVENFEQLFNLRFAGEQGLAEGELSEEAADAPYVDLVGVEVLPEEHLRGSVPESSCFSTRTLSLLGILRRVGHVLLDADAAQCEVADLYLATVTDQDVVWFEVAVHQALRMTEHKSNEDLLGDGLDL